jgi:hypothetical protein
MGRINRANRNVGQHGQPARGCPSIDLVAPSI